MRLAVLVGVLMLAVTGPGCSGNENLAESVRETPPASAAAQVVFPDLSWGPSGCSTDAECATGTLAECTVARCDKGQCVTGPAALGSACWSEATEGLECAESVCTAGADGSVTCSGWRAARDGLPCGPLRLACGKASVCETGLCKDPCDDGNPCTVEHCEESGCVAEPVDGGPCDDGNPCTGDDTCKDGACAGVKACDCVEDADCAAKEDGNLCNGTLRCVNGACKVDPATVVNCGSKPWPCVKWECEPSMGECVKSPLPDGGVCDDSVPCTTGDVCVGGECHGTGGPGCEWNCFNGLDDDGDGTYDCQDQDCLLVPPCKKKTCGNGQCEQGEDCVVCPEDCTDGCEVACGDGVCHKGECESCPKDCVNCPGMCNDGVCSKNEDCLKCPADCGTCPVECGDGDCGEGENCHSCPGDCGQCPTVCGDAICEPPENCSTCDDCGCEPIETCIDGDCCMPVCFDMECGDDECGGVCGQCLPNFECKAGECKCTPDCVDKECGDDGCGGTCSTCPPGYECQFGVCELI